MSKRILVILTLDRHRDGIWITKLVDALNSVMRDAETKNRDSTASQVKVSVLSLESFLSENSPDNLFQGWVGLINRVSDAAPPHLYKACLAVLHSAVACRVKVWNGPVAYATCGNKWCHHVLFQQAGLSSPETQFIFSKMKKLSDTSKDEQSRKAAQKTGFPLLIKANAGGFGEGMLRVDRAEDLKNNIPEYDDGMALYQEYVVPRCNENYRIWFLHGKVQCGVVRTIDKRTDLASGCVGGVCKRTPSAQEEDSPSLNQFESWAVPTEVVIQVEKQLLPLIPDAHAGSVEFLYNGEGQRLYFDLNLLSTLPTQAVNNRDTWQEQYDPWKEMACAILNFVKED